MSATVDSPMMEVAEDASSMAPALVHSPDDEHSSFKKKKKSVGFAEEVSIRVLPAEEADDAFVTRKGEWGAAPDHDELWDGDSKEFWDQEKTLEEVHRIVVIRQLRLTIQYNLGYAFYATVANFKRRRSCLSNDDVIPQFETVESEDAALRKELREIFQDSVKGLDFADLMQDRIAFEKVCAALTPGRPGIEAFIDEIMSVQEICIMIDAPLHSSDLDILETTAMEISSSEAQIEDAVGKEEKRRGDQRAAYEAQNNGVPAYGERRASIEARKLIELMNADKELAAARAEEDSLPTVQEESFPQKNQSEEASEIPVPQPSNSATGEPGSTQASVVGIKKLEFQKSGFHSSASAADVRIFAEVFEGTTISNEDRIRYSQRFTSQGIKSVKQLAALSTAELTSMEVRVFDAKQIVRRCWVVTRKV